MGQWKCSCGVNDFCLLLYLCLQIKAAVLLMLGGKDRRVSPHQGLELYKALKSRGSPVRYRSECRDIKKIKINSSRQNCLKKILSSALSSFLSCQTVVVSRGRTLSVQGGHAGRLLPQYGAVAAAASLSARTHTCANAHVVVK